MPTNPRATRRTPSSTASASTPARGGRWPRWSSSSRCARCCRPRRASTPRPTPHRRAKPIRWAAGAGCRCGFAERRGASRTARSNRNAWRLVPPGLCAADGRKLLAGGGLDLIGAVTGDTLLQSACELGQGVLGVAEALGIHRDGVELTMDGKAERLELERE